jgi:hypothetical protein
VSPRASKPWLRASVAVACVLAQLAGVAHLLLVRHATCAEHGEIVHLDATHGDAGEDAPTGHAALRAADGLGEAHEHDHCVVASGRRAVAGKHDETRGVQPPDPPSLHPQRVDRSVSTPSALAVYLVAPKCSPPIWL